MHRNRSTKIVATLGPSSDTEAMITALFDAGVDIFRLNFSHGSHDDHLSKLQIIRKLEASTGRAIGILADLQGPKIRVAKFIDDAVELEEGASFRLDLDTTPGDGTRVGLPHPEVYQALRDGARILLDDGKLCLEVVHHGADFAETRVVTGGRLSNRKGVNLPDVMLPLSALSEKDRADLEFALGIGVDWIALSFVQRPDDVAEARSLIAGRAGVLVKLEKPAALDHLSEIIHLSDALMVARGDLGVELPPERVPGVQRRIVHEARLAGKPVVVATQMLESMIDSPTPTRAEASDVATAVYEGADAVMLSAESAAGHYPREAVEMMHRIIVQVEHDPLYRTDLDAERATPEHTTADAISAAARQVAETLDCAAIVTYTNSGSTTLRAARERPVAPLVALTPVVATARRLALVWGVHSVTTADVSNFAEVAEKSVQICHQEGFVKSGDLIAITAGVPFGTPGATNLLRIAEIP
jgi:pyruvate kinase